MKIDFSTKAINSRLKDYDKVLQILAREDISAYVSSNLRQSLKSIGFSDSFIEDLVSNLKNLDDGFLVKYQEELNQIETVGFFQDIVPSYFSNYVAPLVPPVKKVLDIGCGTGILAHVLSKDFRFEKIIGIDLKPYPEWQMFGDSKTQFLVVPEDKFAEFVGIEKPNAITLTWTLHHMELSEQERYLTYLRKLLLKGTRIVILEDSYSTRLEPLHGSSIASGFSRWSDGDKEKIMFMYCWVANRILSQRDKVPTPSGFRSLEEWSELFKKLGFHIESETFIGFPDKRDINTPQSVIVISVA